MKIRKILEAFKNKIKKKPGLKEKTTEARIEEIFHEIRDINSKRSRFENQIHRNNQRKKDLDQYKNLTEKEYKQVGQLLNQYKGIVEERKLLEGRLIRNNPALRVIQSFEEEIPEFIKEIKRTEISQLNSRTDVLYIREEKNELYDFRELLISGYRALKTSAILLGLGLFVFIIVLFAKVGSLGQRIIMPANIIIIALIIIGFLMLLLKRKIEYELDLNEKMQNRASKLLNRAKIRFFHNTNYLNYQYDRLGIKNSGHLQAQYDRYIKHKDNEGRYGKMNKQLMEIEQDIFDILYEKGIERDVFEDLEEWAEIQNIPKLIANLDAKIKNAREQIKSLEEYEQEILQEAFIIAKTNPGLKGQIEELLTLTNKENMNTI